MVGINRKTLQPDWALEIKWSDRYVNKPSDLKSLIRFCTENKLQRALITSLTSEEQRLQEGIELNFMPASVYAYTIGVNTINR